ncbi:MAG: hypothetical protein AAF514_07680 [Verrucomicrobiota bacterium]
MFDSQRLPYTPLIEAQGFYQLGMIEDSQASLDRVPEEDRQSPEYRELQVLLLLWEGAWDEAIEASQGFVEAFPRLAFGYIHIAFAQHEQGKTEEALETLYTAPGFLRGEPVYHYNVACYHASLNQISEATEALSKSFRMDRRLKTWASNDPDLSNLRYNSDLFSNDSLAS